VGTLYMSGKSLWPVGKYWSMTFKYFPSRVGGGGARGMRENGGGEAGGNEGECPHFVCGAMEKL
jgi:hypothetical protein